MSKRAWVCAAWLGVMGLGACATQPEIPEQTGERRAYRSTGEVGGADGEGGEGDALVKEGDAEATPPAAEREGPPKAAGPVAIVNGEPIGAEVFNTQAEQLLAAGRIDAKMLWDLREQLVDNLVNQKLLEQAIAGAEVEVTEDDIDAKLAEARADFELFRKMNPGTTTTFEQMLRSLGMDPSAPREGFRKAIVIERVLESRGYSKPEESEVKAFYDGNLEQFKAPARARARHILVKVEAGAPEADWEAAKVKAAAITQEARAPGADFAELAKAKSEGPSGPSGGDLGFFTRDKMVKPFADAVWGMKVGEVSEPVRTRFGWHVIKKEEFQAEGPLPFDTIKEPLGRQLAAQRFQVALKGYIEALREEGKIEVMLQNIR